ncbi:MAG: hypothetical protein P8176_04795, partial [Gammaproteobacteria bacterium]
YSACFYRAETSTNVELRSPCSTSGQVQLSGEHNSSALTQGHLKQSEPKQKLVPVPLELRLPKEDDNTRIRPNTLMKRISRQQVVPVPLEYRLHNEDEHTRISHHTLTQRRRDRELVSVPLELRCRDEDDNTRIKHGTLLQRKLYKSCVPVPPEFRRDNENDHTRISRNALRQRMRPRRFLPVPPEFRRDNEDDSTQINSYALVERKRRKLKSAALSCEKPLASHQTGETSVLNTLLDSNSTRQNSPILARSPSGSNALLLHESTSQGIMEADETLPPFESETAFSHWLDDRSFLQESTIDTC